VSRIPGPFLPDAAAGFNSKNAGLGFEPGFWGSERMAKVSFLGLGVMGYPMAATSPPRATR
jgi:hypothetical protein